MDGLALLGILLIVYSAAVAYITFKKPEGIWNMSKISSSAGFWGRRELSYSSS